VEQPQNSSTKAFFFITPPLLNMATRKDAILLLFFSLLLLPVAHGVFAKRGVATNEWSGGCADILALSNIFWYYDWSPTVLLPSNPPTNLTTFSYEALAQCLRVRKQH